MKIYLIAPSGASPDMRSPEAGLRWLKEQGVVVRNAVCTERVLAISPDFIWDYLLKLKR